MRRPLRIAVALSAFALGLTLAGAGRQLPYAVPAVLLVYLALSALWRRVSFRTFDGHRFMVVTVTLLLWGPLVLLFLSFLAAGTGGSCVALDDEDLRAIAAEDRPAPVRPAPPEVEWDAAELCRPGADDDARASTAKVVWGGILDRKARSKPRPPDPSWPHAPAGPREVAVAVVVDATGRVLVARPLAGTPTRRRVAARAACDARFYPANLHGEPPLVSGVLTYYFGD